MKKYILLTLVATLLLSACTMKVVKRGEESDEIMKKTLALNNFNEIQVAGSLNVEFVQDSVYKVEVTTAKYAIERANVYVKDSMLYVGRKDYGMNDAKKFLFIGNDCITVEVHAPSINKVNIAGRGTFTSASALKTNNLHMSIAGSGRIDVASIEANHVNAEIAGSGHQNFKIKNAAATNLSIAGSGLINANFENCDSVRTGIAGSGFISLSGDVKKFEGDPNKTGINELTIKE